jgi:hypothetical protein
MTRRGDAAVTRRGFLLAEGHFFVSMKTGCPLTEAALLYAANPGVIRAAEPHERQGGQPDGTVLRWTGCA